MKTPDLKKLGDVKSGDHFIKTVQTESDKASIGMRKTFSIQKRDFDYINFEALRMSQEAGKVVSVSKALRCIIQRDRRTRE